MRINLLIKKNFVKKVTKLKFYWQKEKFFNYFFVCLFTVNLSTHMKHMGKTAKVPNMLELQKSRIYVLIKEVENASRIFRVCVLDPGSSCFWIKFMF